MNTIHRTEIEYVGYTRFLHNKLVQRFVYVKTLIQKLEIKISLAHIYS